MGIGYLHSSATTTPGSPTSRFTLTRRRAPRSGSCERRPHSPATAAPWWNECCRTTCRPSAPIPGAMHALTCARARRTRPHRPQANGKWNAPHRAQAGGWAYALLCASETERRAALPGWLAFCNHRRFRSAISGALICRMNNPPGRHSRGSSSVGGFRSSPPVPRKHAPVCSGLNVAED